MFLFVLSVTATVLLNLRRLAASQTQASDEEDAARG